MKLTQYRLALPAIGMFLVLGSPGFGQSPGDDHNMSSHGTAMTREDQTLDLSQVPQSVRHAAEKALGTAPKEATMVAGTNPQEYKLTATDESGKAESVRVLEDGKILKKGPVRTRP